MIPRTARQQVHARASDTAVSSFGSGLSSGKWQEGPEGLFSARSRDWPMSTGGAGAGAAAV